MFGRKKRERELLKQIEAENKRIESLEHQLHELSHQHTVEASKPTCTCGKSSRPKADWIPLHNNGPVPIAQPADFIQLTPIVQPVPLVPYSTQKQPLLMFDEDED